MKNRNEILEEDFEDMLNDAIEDLYKTGLKNDEIFMIIEKQFGHTFAKKLCHDISEQD